MATVSILSPTRTAKRSSTKDVLRLDPTLLVGRLWRHREWRTRSLAVEDSLRPLRAADAVHVGALRINSIPRKELSE
jgi:hypothetical protein